MKAQLPRLSVMLAKILVKHPRRQDVLRPLAEAFRPMRTELEDHPMKEETILFPLIRQLESSGVDRAFHCGSVRHPVRVMVMEHDSAGEALARLRELTEATRRRTTPATPSAPSTPNSRNWNGTFTGTFTWRTTFSSPGQ